MRHIILTTLALGLFLGLQATGTGAEASKNTPETAKQEKKEKYRPFNGLVKAINKETKTITLAGDKAQEFRLSAETVVKKEGQPATWESIEVGVKVGGRAREAADGKWEAVSINVGTKAPKEPPKNPETQ